MADGYLTIVLHAHLPYVRHPEYPQFLEERWFFEAMTETYLPLLRMLEKLENDNVDYRLVISLSPTLVAMFEDELLQDRYAHHLRQLIGLAGREVERTLSEPKLYDLAKWYEDFFRDALYWFEERYQRRVAPAFARLASMGRLTIMTCGATHGFFPFLRINERAVRAQVFTAVDYHAEVFGVPPQGLWIPECAYYPGVESILDEAGIRFFFVDGHAFDNASVKPRYGVHAPLVTPAGPVAFARDAETSHQVWAAEVGYPGHPDYREFYRDVGYDLDEEQLGELLVGGYIRAQTGIKYYRITSRDEEEKEFYDPKAAFERACEHAGNFVFNRHQQLNWLGSQMDRPPLIVSPYDAELFGHWWFEGPWFLDILFRKLCCDQERIQPISPLEYLQGYPDTQVGQPAASSWGAEGTYEFWLNPTNELVYKELHVAADKLSKYVERIAADEGGDKQRLLQQMMRELMLAQASDWPFIMRTGTSPDYARKRIDVHLSRFESLSKMLESGVIDRELLDAIEFTDNLFPNIRPELYGGAPVCSHEKQ